MLGRAHRPTLVSGWRPQPFQSLRSQSTCLGGNGNRVRLGRKAGDDGRRRNTGGKLSRFAHHSSLFHFFDLSLPPFSNFAGLPVSRSDQSPSLTSRAPAAAPHLSPWPMAGQRAPRAGRLQRGNVSRWWPAGAEQTASASPPRPLLAPRPSEAPPAAPAAAPGRLSPARADLTQTPAPHALRPRSRLRRASEPQLP